MLNGPFHVTDAYRGLVNQTIKSQKQIMHNMTNHFHWNHNWNNYLLHSLDLLDGYMNIVSYTYALLCNHKPKLVSRKVDRHLELYTQCAQLILLYTTKSRWILLWLELEDLVRAIIYNNWLLSSGYLVNLFSKRLLYLIQGDSLAAECMCVH